MSNKILILEDDKNLSKSLGDFCKQRGAEVSLSHSAQEAERLIAIQSYDILIVDLVLPKKTGLDFLKQAISQNQIQSNCAIWLLSGVLGPNILPKEIKNRVSEFFKKPLDMRLLEQKFLNFFIPEESKKIHPFYTFHKTQFDYPELFKQNKEFKSHELILLYLSFCHSGFSGELSVQYDNEDPVNIFFKDGKIIGLEMNDKESYLGSLLIKHNVISPEKLEKMLQHEENSLLTLGEKLISQCIVSPHMLHKILNEQLKIRLSKTMSEESVKINYSNIIPAGYYEGVSVGLEELFILLDNWIYSKVDLLWIEEFFNICQDMVLVPAKETLFSSIDSASQVLKFIKAYPIRKPVAVQSLIDHPKFKNETPLRKLYARILVKDCYLRYSQSRNKNVLQTHDFMKNRFEKYIKDADSKNYFSLLDLPWKASSEQVTKRYKNMVQMIHPDSLDKKVPKEVQKVYEKYFVLIKKAYDVLSHPDKRTKYIREIESGADEDVFDIFSRYNEGKKELKIGKYESAFKHFSSILEFKKLPETIFCIMFGRI